MTWKLRPNAVWHDGTPFTADDVAFSYQVNRDPDVPNPNQAAVRLIERLEVVDPTTLVAFWSEVYPFADRLEHREFFPLPRHLLERIYREDKDALLNQPYFSTEYVGLGPYRLTSWEYGSHIEVAAFDRYFLGRPKLDTIQVRFITDPNAMVANLRAGAIQTMLTTGTAGDYDSMLPLKREWEAARTGTVLIDPIAWRFAEPQKQRNPQPADLVAPRVRQALLMGIDRLELGRVVYGEHAAVADSWILPQAGYYGQVQNAITRYPHDPRRAEAVLAELGWRRGADGVLEKGGQRFVIAIRVSGRDDEKEGLVVADNWKSIGVSTEMDIQTGPAAARDRELQASFTGISFSRSPTSVMSAIRRFATYNIPTAENRWSGSNRGGYTSPAWDDLERRILSTIEERTRTDLERDLVRIFTAELQALPLFYTFDLVPVAGGLTGIQPNTGSAHIGAIMQTWNVHEWDRQ